MLTENTATATKGIIDNFEAMNRTAGTESRKATEAVREANKALIGEMAQSLTDAGRRFTEVSREMRQAAQDLQRELAATREEVKRGVLELPEEAREGAEALRRVVGDQLKALTELSEIVNRHGKSLDVSTPALGEPKPQKADPTIAVGDTGAANGVRTTNGASAMASPKGSAARGAPRASGSANSGGFRPSIVEDETKEGWVTDLLRRASEDEGVTPPTAASVNGNGAATATAGQVPAPRAGGSNALNAFSGDIARAIDHNAAVELWDRHSRGEKNLFTRRLYTLQGQQTFDEIRKKYQRDKEFRAAVDRYVADFEKLLAEVTKNGRERMAGNAYLTSDTGKVYTMLAHASGRFD
jgi:hypothetical protein